MIEGDLAVEGETGCSVGVAANLDDSIDTLDGADGVEAFTAFED